MNIDTTLRVRLDAVIQLIHEYTNMPIVQQPKIYTSCQAIVVPKPAGRFAFVNAAGSQFSVNIEVPSFLSETVTLNAGFEDGVRIVRMSPSPDHVFGGPQKGQTYLCGVAKPYERVFLHCPVNFCRIIFVRLLEDGRAMIDPEYFPKRYFLSEQPVTINVEGSVTAEPVMTVRADSSGKYLAAAEELREGCCTVLEADGSVRKEYPFKLGGRRILE